MELPPIFTLPDELILAIAREAAPDGGKRAGALRLVCRHLERVVAPVVWSSITFPLKAVELDEVCFALLSSTVDRASFVTSVKYHLPDSQMATPLAVLGQLSSLKRLHLVGNSSASTVLRAETLRVIRAVTSLRLENLNVVGQLNVRDWGKSLNEFEIITCAGERDPFVRQDGEQLYYAGLPDALGCFRHHSRERGAAAQKNVLQSLYGLLGNKTVREICIHWPDVLPLQVASGSFEADVLFEKVARPPRLILLY